jgi:hypothetical protein
MPSTPLICSSIGATTVVATTCAFAPGYWPETLIVGGAISGYCATGRLTKLTSPSSTMMIETTEAKIGRSMKKCDMGNAAPYFAADGVPAGAPGGRSPSAIGITLMPGRARIKPFTMMRSFGSIPFRTTRNPLSSAPSVTYFC